MLSTQDAYQAALPVQTLTAPFTLCPGDQTYTNLENWWRPSFFLHYVVLFSGTTTTILPLTTSMATTARYNDPITPILIEQEPEEPLIPPGELKPPDVECEDVFADRHLPPEFGDSGNDIFDAGNASNFSKRADSEGLAFADRHL